MVIAVIAANGRTGSAFVRAALMAGHTVRAGIHGRDTLKPHDNLTTFECDATNPDDLARLIKGSDAVASFIGHTKNSPRYVQSDAIRHLLKVSGEMGIKRIVSLTGTGVRMPGDVITLIDRVLNLSISIIDPARVRDGIQHANILKKSDSEWTILRVLKLQNTPPRPFQLRANGPTKVFISRQDVAKAALDVIENHTFVMQMPILGS
ncbi:NAD(P)H-binding protein [Microbacteriaceae bacterium]|nr:NAD(P)H-binding protein [Candidatus Saccharibacteria bacterium]